MTLHRNAPPQDFITVNEFMAEQPTQVEWQDGRTTELAGVRLVSPDISWQDSDKTRHFARLDSVRCITLASQGLGASDGLKAGLAAGLVSFGTACFALEGQSYTTGVILVVGGMSTLIGAPVAGMLYGHKAGSRIEIRFIP